MGTETEFERVWQLLKETHAKPSFVGFVNAEDGHSPHTNYIGDITQLDEIIKVHQINEIVFCAKDISSQDIINYMLTMVSSGVDFKIASPDSLSIIGSNNIDTAGDLYMIDVNSITKATNQRNKRLLDMGVSIIAIAFSPVLLFVQENKSRYFYNCFGVLFGFYSWVGYGKSTDRTLPQIKKSVLFPGMLATTVLDLEKNKILNLRYAKDYKLEKDLIIIWKCIKKLGS